MSSIMRVIEQLHAWSSLRSTFGTPIERIPHRKLNKVLTFYEPGAGLPPARAAKMPSDEEQKQPNKLPEYWSVQCNGLTEFAGVRCRNVDAKFEQFTVLTRLALGLSNRPGTGATKIEPEVQVRLQLASDDAEQRTRDESELSPLYRLSLDAQHHFQTWTIHGTHLPTGTDDVWKTGGHVDYAVMHIFVFDIQDDGTVTPLEHSDDEERADMMNLLAACRRFSPASKNQVIHDDGDTVSSKFFRDDLFRTGGSAPSVEVGRTTSVRTVPTRIAVALTLTCYKQTGDFQPAPPVVAVAGAARFFPVVQVASTRRVAELRASVDFDRPSTSEWDANHGCHGSRDISTMCVTDTNDGARIGVIAQALPTTCWSSLFNYQLPNAEESLGGEELHLVRAGKAAPAPDLNSNVVRKVPGLERSFSRVVSKVARQGEFDNVHISPKMSLVEAKFALVHEYVAGGLLTTTPELVDLSDRDRFKLDNLTMAPFCAHDCLHMHWRWTDIAPQMDQLGFSNYEPNMIPGAPMVPSPQDVYLWFRARACLTYHAEHFDEAGASAGSWVPICHHGAAYLTDSLTAPIAGAQMETQTRSRVKFLRSADEFDVINSYSWAAFYWNIRYYMEKDGAGQYRAVDRTTSSDGFRGARRL